ncbi:MAG: 50S ribosomal protein L7Ae [Candidatus Micrarchaeota archaeon]
MNYWDKTRNGEKMKAYIEKETPKDVQQKALELLEKARQSGGRLRKGTNEATKAIERSEARVVVIAGDVDPEEIVMHLPILSKEKGISFCFVDTKIELGKAAGLGVGTSAVALGSPGSAENELKELIEKLGGQKLMPAAKPAVKAIKPKKTTTKKKKEEE